MSLFCSVQFSLSVVSDSLQPHELQQARPPCSSPTPGVHSNSRPSSRWCHPAISSSVVRFSSCPQSLQYFGHHMRSIDSFERDSDAGKDWGQEEKRTTEDEMAGWYHRLDGHEFGWTLGVGLEQGGLVCCSSWGRKESDMTEWLNWTEYSIVYMYHSFLIHLSANGYLGCFHVLDIINSAVMNIGVHMSLSILVSSVCMPSTVYNSQDMETT